MSYNSKAILLSLGTTLATLLLTPLTTTATVVSAHNTPGGYYAPGSGYGPGGGYGPAYSPYTGPGSSNASPYYGFGGRRLNAFLEDREKIIIAHGVLAALAFVIFFPAGSILIRLGAFRGLWLVHGLFQIFAYLVYTAAFGIGIWIVQEMPYDLLNSTYYSYHPIIGIVVFVFLFFQPILGMMHHIRFKMVQRRTVWSYGHLWLGRIVITLGIINGGLGMLLATQTGWFVPTRGQMIAYGVIAAFMWLAWVFAAIVGERRRARSTQVVNVPHEHKEQYS